MKQNKKTNFTRHFFIDLAKECGLNATIFEQLGSRRDTEIVVDNDTLEMLVRSNLPDWKKWVTMNTEDFISNCPALLRKNGEIAKRRS